jgi:hypothetical protein
MDSSPILPLPDGERDAAMIGGTLCLMSCYLQHRHPAYAARIAKNLASLADSATLSAELRTICDRLARRWDTLREDAERVAHEVPPYDRRTLQ